MSSLPNPRFDAVLSVVTALLLTVSSASAHMGEGAHNAAQQEYPFVLPILGQKAIDAGEELPLPFGISFAYYYVDRDIEVSTVSASINNNPVQSVDDYFAFDVGTTVHTATVRLDTWIFPFLNVYGLFGHIDNTSKINARVNLGGNEYTLQADGGFEGMTSGVGMVLAAGYQDFFMTLDGNYVYTDLGNAFNSRFEGQIYNARAGWKGKIDGHNTRIWLGATYWDTERTMSGSIPVNGGPVQKINFEVTQKPVNPSNFSIGCNYEFNEHYNIVVDLGSNFKDATIFLLSLNYRFHE
ncbi:hypothetical protein [Coraliomargarita akajimensis]|uniref:Transporter n=1 Tax=Coraliomargarita akajimensis (strain DSM 45221 / IAM 15411 / JCM 23193 / KCTC 12865 / 04OKA010-24) TaxID=583355 RepID=D5EQ20_CORAD|nr:hypothetical protein [Coraliomargarita akajimensis]ADE55753.1 conserved hypothetical protein [Coraliomargarita akajimensis DSM 45221]